MKPVKVQLAYKKREKGKKKKKDHNFWDRPQLGHLSKLDKGWMSSEQFYELPGCWAAEQGKKNVAHLP